MLDRPQIVRAPDDALRQQESRRELTIGARRPHDDGKRPPVQADFERLFSRHAIRARRREAAAHVRDGDGSARNVVVAVVREHAIDERLPLARIRQLPLVDDRQFGQPLAE